MFNLIHPNIKYMIINPNNDLQSSEISSLLDSKNYTIFFLETYNTGCDKSFICENNQISTDSFNNDINYFINKFQLPYIISKLPNKLPEKIFMNGDIIKMNLTNNYEDTMPLYVYEGFSFAFSEEKQYHYPKNKQEIEVGMVVEYMNNDQWKEKKVINIEKEWEDMYKLLIKYNKMRIRI